ncbi:hypothetical protein H4R33_006058 [Dimargaris cristalligena]|nr:hypothetical protein H4R33_006058 [Dimargaris cristalligena]
MHAFQSFRISRRVLCIALGSLALLVLTTQPATAAPHHVHSVTESNFVHLSRRAKQKNNMGTNMVSKNVNRNSGSGKKVIPLGTKPKAIKPREPKEAFKNYNSKPAKADGSMTDKNGPIE